MRKLTTIAIWMMTLVLVSAAASAFAVSSPYWNDNPLRLAPGQSHTFELTLQNMIEGDGDIMAVVAFSGDGVAALKEEKTEYLVPSGTANVKVPVMVLIPADAEAGKRYSISMGISQKSQGVGGGQVQLTASYQVTIPVVVAGDLPAVEQPLPEARSPHMFGLVASVVAIVILVGIVIMLEFHRTDHQPRKKKHARK